MQKIYYDHIDAEMDNGRGWNVVEEGTDIGTAYRFSNLTEAMNFCETNNLPYRVMVEECYETYEDDE
jgi:pterin-4a-carbinolamine dehydratase